MVSHRRLPGPLPLHLQGSPACLGLDLGLWGFQQPQLPHLGRICGEDRCPGVLSRWNQLWIRVSTWGPGGGESRVQPVKHPLVNLDVR